MPDTAIALVRWLSRHDGKSPPSGLRYSTVAKWDDDGPNWTEQAWSVVLQFDVSPLEQFGAMRATISFLVPDAPVERLKVGRKCELFDGRHKVADVEIIEATDDLLA